MFALHYRTGACPGFVIGARQKGRERGGVLTSQGGAAIPAPPARVSGAVLKPGLQVTGQRFWPGRIGSRVSVTDPVSVPVFVTFARALLLPLRK